MKQFTIHQPMMVYPIYLLSRFLYADELVLLTTDYAKKDGWHTRFKIQTQQGPVIIPVPLVSRTGKLINELVIDKPEFFYKKLRKTLEQAYGKSPHWGLVQGLIPWGDSSFCEFSITLLTNIVKYLGLGLKLTRDTDLNVTRDPDASTWLAEIGYAINGNVYYCAFDAPSKYLRVEPFKERSMFVNGQVYVLDAPYPADTSILHLLFTEPKERVLELLRG